MKKDFEVMERLAKFGTDVCSDRELIGIVLGSDKKVARLLGSQDLFTDSTTINPLRTINQPFAEIKFRGKLTDQETARLMAAIALGIRIVSQECPEERPHISSPSDAAQYLMPKLRHLEHEYFGVLCLNTKNRILANKIISEGSLTCSVVHPREVLDAAIVNHAASILVYHNHPSGDPCPSEEDKGLTSVLNESCKIMGIPLLDHVVIGDGRYYSFKEHGKL